MMTERQAFKLGYAVIRGDDNSPTARDNRMDRWYVFDSFNPSAPRTGTGFWTIRETLNEIEKLERSRAG